MTRNREKSRFLHCEKDVWDRLSEETRLCGELVEQLGAARREVDKLAPASQKLASLRIRETDACKHIREAEKKLAALIERARMDAVVSEQLWKE